MSVGPRRSRIRLLDGVWAGLARESTREGVGSGEWTGWVGGRVDWVNGGGRGGREGDRRRFGFDLTGVPELGWGILPWPSLLSPSSSGSRCFPLAEDALCISPGSGRVGCARGAGGWRFEIGFEGEGKKANRRSVFERWGEILKGGVEEKWVKKAWEWCGGVFFFRIWNLAERRGTAAVTNGNHVILWFSWCGRWFPPFIKFCNNHNQYSMLFFYIVHPPNKSTRVKQAQGPKEEGVIQPYTSFIPLLPFSLWAYQFHFQM